MAHPDSTLISGGNLALHSPNTVRGDAHYLSGGQVKFEQPDGLPAHLFSPYDPIILSAGDVSLGNYSGALLHVLAGGRMTLNTVTITGAGAAATTINLANNTTFNGSDKLGDLTKVNLSNSKTVVVDGSAVPTLDVRAGVDWRTFSGGAPNDQVLPRGVIAPTFGPVTDTSIIVSGVISMTQPGGMVLLTNQYRPNRLAGKISTGDILGNTAQPNSNGSSVTIDARLG